MKREKRTASRSRGISPIEGSQRKKEEERTWPAINSDKLDTSAPPSVSSPRGCVSICSCHLSLRDVRPTTSTLIASSLSLPDADKTRARNGLKRLNYFGKGMGENEVKNESLYWNQQLEPPSGLSNIESMGHFPFFPISLFIYLFFLCVLLFPLVSIREIIFYSRMQSESRCDNGRSLGARGISRLKKKGRRRGRFDLKVIPALFFFVTSLSLLSDSSWIIQHFAALSGRCAKGLQFASSSCFIAKHFFSFFQTE